MLSGQSFVRTSFILIMSVSAAKVNPDTAREREKASFNPIELTYLLHGGREKTERKRYLGKIYI